MNLKDTLQDDSLHNIVLDAAAIADHSIRDDQVILPYSKGVSEVFPGSEVYIKAVIHINSGIDLKLTSPSCKRSFLIDCSVEEKISLMDRFFGVGDGKNGLSDYWSGFYWATYAAWRTAVLQPLYIVSAIAEGGRDNMKAVSDMLSAFLTSSEE